MSRNRFPGVLVLCVACVLAFGCAKSVDIGAVISESGAAAVYGERVRKGIDLALDEVNAAGGHGGKPINVIYMDDQTRPEVGKAAVETLINEYGVRLIIGAVSSSVALKIAPICEENEVVLLSPTASSPKITDAGEYVFRNYPSDILEGTSMADFARDLGLERLVVFAVNNEFGHGLKDVFVEKYPSKFRSILETFEFDEGDAAALAEAVEITKGLDPDGIYVVGYVTDLAEIVSMLREAGIDAIAMGSSSITGDIVRLAGAAAENLVYPQPSFDLTTDDPNMQAFIQAYRAKYNEEPDRFAAHGYDSLMLLMNAMKFNDSPHPNDVKSGLGNTHDFQGASGRIGFDQNGDVVQYPRLFIIRDGAPVSYEKFIEDGGSLQVPGRS
jgi:branched-chain amino acid transport system substrate-binding protein